MSKVGPSNKRLVASLRKKGARRDHDETTLVEKSMIDSTRMMKQYPTGTTAAAQTDIALQVAFIIIEPILCGYVKTIREYVKELMAKSIEDSDDRDKIEVAIKAALLYLQSVANRKLDVIFNGTSPIMLKFEDCN